MRVGIVGSRKFTNFYEVRAECLKHLKDGYQIKSGGAIGVDTYAQHIAKELGLEITIFYPNYAKYGRPAPFKRNTLIAENSDLLLAFFRKDHVMEGGTLDTVKKAQKLGIKVLTFEEKVINKELYYKYSGAQVMDF